jgi:urate oxidase
VPLIIGRAVNLPAGLANISMACPNRHYLRLNLSPFGPDNDNQVFVATDEPHGQIECTVGR